MGMAELPRPQTNRGLRGISADRSVDMRGARAALMSHGLVLRLREVVDSWALVTVVKVELQSSSMCRVVLAAVATAAIQAQWLPTSVWYLVTSP